MSDRSLWSEIKEVFREWTGMNLPEAVRGSAIKLLDRSAMRADCDPADYLHRLDSDLESRQLFMDHLGLGTTWFMRDAEGLNALVETLESCSAGGRVLSLWSVGCSTGEEPYSLAMALAAAGLRARILATDLNRAALDKARAGLYPAKSLERVPDDWRQRYFRARHDDAFQIAARIRQMVHFRLHNLQDNDPPPVVWPKFDAIICRNVLIYFDKKPALDIIERLESFCSAGGYLLLGAIERPLFWMKRRHDPGDPGSPGDPGDSGHMPRTHDPVPDSARPDSATPGKSARRLIAGELVQIPARPRPDASRLDLARPNERDRTRALSSGGGGNRADTAGAMPSDSSRRTLRRDGPITRLGIQRLLEKAEIAEEEQRHADAFELVEQARRMAPLDPSIHLLRGHILMKSGDVDRAIDSLRTARFLGRDGWLAPYLLARCLDRDQANKNRDIQEAIEAYRYALGALESGAGSGYFRHDPEVEGMAGLTAEACSRRLVELEG